MDSKVIDNLSSSVQQLTNASCYDSSPSPLSWLNSFVCPLLLLAPEVVVPVRCLWMIEIHQNRSKLIITRNSVIDLHLFVNRLIRNTIDNDQFLLTIEIIDMLHINKAPEHCTLSNCFWIFTFPKELPENSLSSRFVVLTKCCNWLL